MDIQYDKPEFLYEFEHSYVELGYYQYFPGYCILFSKTPYASLNAMPYKERQHYLMEMSLLGDAMLEALDSPIRINYATLGNDHKVLHSHLFPRYEWEEENLRKTVVWRYPLEKLEDPNCRFDMEKYGDLKRKLQGKIDEIYQKYLKEQANE